MARNSKLKEVGGEKKPIAETPKLKLDHLLFLFALVFIGRGLVNLYFLSQGDHFDEFFIGFYSQTILNVLFISVGIGLFLRADWAYYIGFPICLVAFTMQSDDNFSERTGGELMTILQFAALWRGWGGKRYKKRKRSLKIALIVLVILLGVIIFEAAQPSGEEIYRKYLDLALSRSDPTICKKIKRTSGIEQCIINVADVLNNQTACDLIETPRYKKLCKEYAIE